MGGDRRGERWATVEIAKSESRNDDESERWAEQRSDKYPYSHYCGVAVAQLNGVEGEVVWVAVQHAGGMSLTKDELNWSFAWPTSRKFDQERTGYMIAECRRVKKCSVVLIGAVQCCMLSRDVQNLEKGDRVNGCSFAYRRRWWVDEVSFDDASESQLSRVYDLFTLTQPGGSFRGLYWQVGEKRGIRDQMVSYLNQGASQNYSLLPFVLRRVSVFDLTSNAVRLILPTSIL